MYQEVDSLFFDLSMTKASSELQSYVDSMSEDSLTGSIRATNLTFSRGNIPRDEPYRLLLAPLRDRCKITAEYLSSIIGIENPAVPPNGYLYSVQQVLDPLMLCYRSLIDSGDEIIADGRIKDLLRQIKAFGLTLVKLDIRQDSSRHADVIDAITEWLDIGNYNSWDEDKKQEWLIQELKSKRPLVPTNWPNLPDVHGISDEVKQVMETLQVLKLVGSEPLGAYVISMAKKVSLKFYR